MVPRPIGRRPGSFPAVAALALALALAAPGRGLASDPQVNPAEARLRADVAYLADDLREGRAPGTKGIDAAADYIAGAFRELGLKPAPGADGYFQGFTIKGSASLSGAQELAFRAKDKEIVARPNTDFGPLALGSGASLAGVPLVFAGYGITARNPKNDFAYDDYAGPDVKGKAVLILRRQPRQNDDKSPFGDIRDLTHSSLLAKATNAFAHEAAAVILVNDRVTAKERDLLLPLGFAGGAEQQVTTIPFAMITRELADSLLKASGEKPLAEVEEAIEADLRPRSKALDGASVAAKYTIERKLLKAKNVVAVLEGAGPTAEETIVVGGHYDHLGHGGFFSGSLAPLSREIHNGADDNASGTSMVLEMARRLAKRADPLPRRVVFMAFSGEEKGLLGSQYYANHPLFPLDKTVFMVNFDMVGRLNDKDELTLFGTNSTPGAAELVDVLGASAGFKIKKVGGLSDGIGGSDHESFYRKGVPVLFAFTGTHRDYHRPTDDTNLINFPGMARIADFGELLLLDLARRPKRPGFVKVGTAMAAGHGGGNAPASPPSSSTAAPGGGDKDTARISISAYLGSIPDYDDENQGVKLSGVGEGSPAEKAGLKGGDVVVGFAGRPIATIYDYTQSLGKASPGETVEIKVRRDGKEVVLKATLGSRPRGN